jgi:ATP-dependent DNA ligase
VARVLPLTDAEYRVAVDDPNWGVSEKVNGQRCIARVGDRTVQTYNRSGGATLSVPSALQRLHDCPRRFVLDGERLDGPNAGAYVAFDLLECDGEDYRVRPCGERLAAMRDLLADLGLLHDASYRLEPRTSHADRLAVLLPVTDAKGPIVEGLRAAGAEGVIFRDLHAPYTPGDCRSIRKWKFVSDVDCIVVGANNGAAGGSLRLALRRPSDDALIAVGSVRSGLGQSDITAIRARLECGERPVIRVTFLPARTVGVALVEPTAAGADLRDDKRARECVTDQLLDLLPDCAPLIAAAPAVGVLA